MELGFLQEHQLPLPLGLLCLQDAQSAPFQTSIIMGIKYLLTLRHKCFTKILKNIYIKIYYIDITLKNKIKKSPQPTKPPTLNLKNITKF